ncbi:F-box protein AFR-like [Triticum dicoccoides]|uniref:F-box domain-containing protein n=2 Tax=Triticum aestivum TaxID=4565 RepID=A0A3B6RMJ0_WHEAT|nr:F-box protein AFR-like [Triticum dicoccoides]
MSFSSACKQQVLGAGGEEAREEEGAMELIPGLPEEVAEKCLLHLPFLYHRLFRTVSSNWNRFLTDAPGAAAKTKGSAPPAATVSLSLPFLFAFAFDPVSRRLQCQALDPFSRRWLLLPPVPCGAAAGSFAVVGLPARGEIYVIGGVEEGGDKAVSSVAVYSAATNGWGQVAGMRTARGYMAAGEVGGRVVVAGEDGEAEVFDPEAGRWSPAAPRGGAAVARYDAAAAGGKLYVTEGWAWPFERAPRGAVYDAAADAWSDMARGMREGWTGSCAVSGGRMYIVAEYGEWRLKRYDEPRDEWRMVAGGGVPQEVRRPHVVAGQLEEVGGGRRRIYVVGAGLDVAVGTVVSAANHGAGTEEERVEWEVVKGPEEFVGLAPCNAQVLYA